MVPRTKPETNSDRFGVYKAYKEGAPDTSYLWIFDDEEDAKKAVERMEALRRPNRLDVFFAESEGWEFRAYWTYEKVKPSVTLEDFYKEVNETLKHAWRE